MVICTIIELYAFPMLLMWSLLIPYSTYISWVFNFVNLESFAKFIQLKF